MFNWPRRRECLRLIFAENIWEFSVYGGDMSSIISRHNLCLGAGSICTPEFSINDWYGAVRRNIQEPGFKTVCHNRPKPRHPVLHSLLGVPVAVIQGSLLDAHLPQLTPVLAAHKSNAWCLSHHHRCFPRSLPAALYEIPLLGRKSRRPSHWPVDR